MFGNEEKRDKIRIEALLNLSDGSEVLGVFFVSPQARFTDLMNDPREFLPIETTSGAITVVRKAAIVRATPVNQDQSLEATDPYALLGMTSSASAEELRETYHDFVRQYHPDHLASLDLPQPFIDFATGHMARINDAYERVLSDRKNQGEAAA